MSYTVEVDSGVHSWEIRFTHSSGVKFQASILNTTSSSLDSVQLESTKDQLFQALVNKIAEFPNVTIDSAIKHTNYTSQCTPT